MPQAVLMFDFCMLFALMFMFDACVRGRFSFILNLYVACSKLP